MRTSPDIVEVERYPAATGGLIREKKKLEKMSYLMMAMIEKPPSPPIKPPSPTPTITPTISPTSSPSWAPTPSPVVDCLDTKSPFPSVSCQPTSGTCAGSSSAITEAVERGDEVVSLCGDTTIETNSALSLALSSASQTICCQTQSCILQSSGSDRNLFISIPDLVDAGEQNLTLSNIIFRGGRAPQENAPPWGHGGNVIIEATADLTNMHVVIENCSFYSGTAAHGGNLYIDNWYGSINLIRSTFLYGQAAWSGGGAYIAASDILIDATTFAENAADTYDFGQSGGLVTTGPSPRDIAIYNSTFLHNVGQSGGVFTSTLGSLSKLSIQLTTFEENRCSGSECGAAAFVINDASNDLHFCANNGSNNTAEGDGSCAGIFIDFPDPGQCVGVAEEYSENSA